MHARRAEGGRIFIAEDNPILLQGLARAVEAQGYAVEMAEDGEAMLALLRSRPAPDLVLLDVMMPGRGGMDVLREMQAEPALAQVPVIVVSAVCDEELVVGALRRGAVDVMMKPFRLRELLARVEVHVRRHGELLRLRELLLQRDAAPARQRVAAG